MTYSLISLDDLGHVTGGFVGTSIPNRMPVDPVKWSQCVVGKNQLLGAPKDAAEAAARMSACDDESRRRAP